MLLRFTLSSLSKKRPGRRRTKFKSHGGSAALGLQRTTIRRRVAMIRYPLFVILSMSGVRVLELLSQNRPSKGGIEDRRWKMEDRRWRMEDGGSRMEDGGWRMEDGGWRIEDGGWMEDRGSRIEDRRW